MWSPALRTSAQCGDLHLLEAIGRLQPHDHLCLIYETPEEQFAAVVPYMRIGLERGERCFYIVDDNTAESVLEAMNQGGVDTDLAIRSGALRIVTKSETYLREGRFDPDRMIEFFGEAVAAARAAGFSAMRVTGEMTWALGSEPGTERLIEYEAKLNRFFATHDALALCQYNRKRFSPLVIRDVIRTHPVVVFDFMVCRNFYYIPPEEFLAPDAAAREADRLLGHIREREVAERLLANHELLENSFSSTHHCVALLDRDQLENLVKQRTEELSEALAALKAEGEQRRQVEAAVRENEARLCSMVDAITESAFLMDPEGTVLACNQSVAARLGCGISELLGKNIYERLPAEVAERRRKYVEQVIASGRTVRFEDERQGRIIDHCLYPVIGQDGKVSAIAVFGQDVTDRKRAEQNLHESREQYRRIVETANDGIWGMDEWQVTTFVNERMASSLGYTVSEMIARPVTDFMFTEDLPDHETHMRKRESGASDRYERRFRHKDGSERWMLVSATALIGDDGRFAGSFGMFTDITDRKHTEQSLERSTRLLDLIRQAQSLFIAQSDPEAVFGSLLHSLVSLTDSQYGFLDEVVREEDGQVFKRNLALTNISWDEDSRRLYDQLRSANFEFRNLNNLSGAPATSGRLVIANDPGRDSRSGGLPPGHPPVNAFMGIPMYFGGELVGVAGVANRPGGYDENIAAFLEPFISTCGSIIHAARNERKEKSRLEETRLTLELLRILNAQSDLHELVKSVTVFLQDWSGCEAVGIRLRQGDDYPYFESRGFPSEFIEAENRLCAVDESDEPIRDSNGDPVLECMCGNVIYGRFDPSLPFFSANGSFWSNCTTDLLASTTEEDRQARTRNRCNGEGYESVALIRLRSGKMPLGLIQLNDKRRDRFSPGMISLLERFAENIGIAVAQRTAEKALDGRTLELDTLFRALPDLYFRVRRDGTILDYRAGQNDDLYVPPAEFLGRPVQSILPEELGRKHYTVIEEVARTGQPATIEYGLAVPSGKKYFEARVLPLNANELITVIRDITDRKQAEEELRRLAHEWQTTFDAVGDAVWLLDADCRILRGNKASVSLLGSDPSEVVGRPCWELVHGTAEPPCECPFRRIQQSLRRESEELPVGDRWFRVTLDPIVDADGKLAGAVHVISDMTERKLAEETLKESEQRVRQKLDALLLPEGDLGALDLVDVIDVPAIQALMDQFCSLTGIGFAIVDLAGKVLVATGWQEICTRFHRVQPVTCRNCVESDTELSAGIEPGEFRLYKCKNNMWDMATPIMVGGKHMGNLFLGQFLFENEEPDREVFRVQARQYGFNEDEYLSALDRVPRWSRMTVEVAMTFYAELAKLISTLSYSSLKLARALAERERAQEALVESERRQRAILDNIPDPAWLKDRAGRYLAVNQAWCQWAGREAHQAIGKANEEILPAEIVGRLRSQDEEVLRSAGPLRMEERFDTVQGAVRWFDTVKAPIFNESGVAVGTVGIGRDITERKQAEKEKEILSLLASRLAACRDIAGMIEVVEREADRLLPSDAGFFAVRPPGGDVLQILHSVDTVDGEKRTFPARPWSLDDCSEILAALLKGESVLLDRDSGEHEVSGFRRFGDESRISRSLMFAPIRSGDSTIGVLSLQSYNHLQYGEDHLRVLRRIADLVAPVVERTWAQEELRESEARFRALAENYPDGALFLFDQELRFLAADGEDLAEVGLSSDQVVGRTVEEVFPEIRETVEPYCRLALEGRSSTYEVAYKERVYSCHTLPISDGAAPIAHGLVVAQDVTERKRAEDSLRASEARFRSYFQLPLIGVAITSPEKGWVEVNDRVCGILGYSREELARMTWAELTHPDDLDADVREFERMLAGEIDQYAMEKRFLRKDGVAVETDLAVGCVRRDDGAVDYVVALIEDITERKQAAAERQRLEELLRQSQKLDALGQLAAGVAHDFNNMLTVIRGQTHMAYAAAGRDNQMKEHLRAIEDAVSQSMDITKSLLTFSRRMPTDKKPIQLGEVVQDARRLLKHALPARIHVVTEIEPACDCTVMADRTQIYQVLLNLAINARDAMPRGGTLRLGVATAVIPEGSARSLPAGTRCVRLSVSDTGTGIEPGLLPRIFDPFFTTKDREQGSGLGLSLVHGIVADHEGYIEVESEVGKGTTFTITLPSLPLDEESPSDSAGPASNGTGELVLVAGPDAFQAGAVGGYLQSVGYRVLLAEDEDQVLEHLEKHGADVRLVILRADIPHHGGPECVRKCRKMLRGLPAILLSCGLPLSDDAAGENTLVIDGPVVLGELARLAREALGLKERTRQ